MTASLLADTGQDMVGDLCLGISVCRECMFGHELGLRPAPDAQQELAFARGLMETWWRNGDVDAESPMYFSTKCLCSMCKSAIKLDVSYP